MHIEEKVKALITKEGYISVYNCNYRLNGLKNIYFLKESKYLLNNKGIKISAH